MIIKSINDVPSIEVKGDNIKDVNKQVLIGKDDGSDKMIMRLFTVQAGGNTPLHTHDFEHLVKIEKGNGIVIDENGEHAIKPGMVIYVKPNEIHQFRNNSNEELQFTCTILA